MKKNLYGHKRIYELLAEIRKLHSRINSMYASNSNPLSNFQRGSEISKKLFKEGINKELAYALVLVSKQIDCVYDIVGEGKKDTLEGLPDKLRDMAVYSLLAIILYEESQKKQVSHSRSKTA